MIDTAMLAKVHGYCRPLVDQHRSRRQRVLKVLHSRPEAAVEARLLETYGEAVEAYVDDLFHILRTRCPVDLKYPN